MTNDTSLEQYNRIKILLINLLHYTHRAYIMIWGVILWGYGPGPRFMGRSSEFVVDEERWHYVKV